MENLYKLYEIKAYIQESIVEKGEIAHHEQFHLLLQNATKLRVKGLIPSYINNIRFDWAIREILLGKKASSHLLKLIKI